MAKMFLDMLNGGQGQVPVEIDPDQDPAGYKRLLSTRASNRRQQTRQQAGPNVAMQMLGNESIGQEWDPLSEGIRAVGENAGYQGKKFRLDTAGLGNVATHEAEGNLADDPNWWLHSMNNATPGTDVHGIMANTDMMPESIRGLYAKQQIKKITDKQ